MLDSTGNSSTNTGSVRLKSTEMLGSLVSSAAGGAGDEFADHQRIGRRATITLPATARAPRRIRSPRATPSIPDARIARGPDGVTTLPGDPIWIDGFVGSLRHGAAGFHRSTVERAEPPLPATMMVSWTGTGTAAPFAALTGSRLDDRCDQCRLRLRRDSASAHKASTSQP